VIFPGGRGIPAASMYAAPARRMLAAQAAAANRKPVEIIPERPRYAIGAGDGYLSQDD